MLLRNEFATVRVRKSVSGNGPRLEIIDLRTGRANYLDPLLLEALAWADIGEWTSVMDPGRRWSDG